MKSKLLTHTALIGCGSLFLTVASASAQSLDWTPNTAIPDNNAIGVADTQGVTADPRAVITGLRFGCT